MFNVQKIYEKLTIAARIIASIPDTNTIIAISGRPYGQRAVYKFAKLTNTFPATGRWTPGMLTNQNTKKYVEPRLLVLTDPRIDYNALIESSYMNIPVIALCNTDNSLQYVDCAIPCNNRSKRSLAMIYWMLTKEVKLIKEELKDVNTWGELPDAFLYRDPEKEIENKEQKQEEEAPEKEGEGQQENQGGDEEEGYDDNFN